MDDFRLDERLIHFKICALRFDICICLYQNFVCIDLKTYQTIMEPIEAKSRLDGLFSIAEIFILPFNKKTKKL